MSKDVYVRRGMTEDVNEWLHCPDPYVYEWLHHPDHYVIAYTK